MSKGLTKKMLSVVRVEGGSEVFDDMFIEDGVPKLKPLE